MIGKTLNNYRIISKIGEGGMGLVYLAEHNTLKRKAAIKCLNPIYASNFEIKKRFLNEAYTLSRLNHNNIVALYDFIEVDSNIYLIMEYAEGLPLNHIIEKVSGPIPENVVRNVFSQILDGFSYAHSQGIIHRDIKPSNIILSSKQTPKILDFGIAKILSLQSSNTRVGDKIGTILYMSPEQVLGKDIDIRADIYSLGVTLFEMLTGKPVYDLTIDTDYVIQTKILKEPLPSPKNFYPEISEHMVNIIKIATEKDKENRFQSCEEFLIALNDITYNFESEPAVPVNKEVKDEAAKLTYKNEADSNNVELPAPKKDKRLEPVKLHPKDIKTEITYYKHSKASSKFKKYFYISLLFFIGIALILISYNIYQNSSPNNNLSQKFKSDKEKLLDLYKETIGFMQSPEYKNIFKEIDMEKMSEYMDDKQKELLKKAGFETVEEVTEAEQKYKDDNDIIEIRKQFDEVSQKITEDIMKEKTGSDDNLKNNTLKNKPKTNYKKQKTNDYVPPPPKTSDESSKPRKKTTFE